MGFRLEETVRLIKADMSVVAQAQKLYVNLPHGGEDLIVLPACFLAVGFRPVGEESPVFVNVHFLKKIFIHKVIIALGILAGKSFVLVQVHCGNL